MPAGTPLFDRALMAKRRQRRQQRDANILTRTIAEELVERLSLINRRFDHVLLIAAEPEHIAARLRETEQVKDITTRLPSTNDDLDLPADAVVCSCNNVTKGELCTAIKEKELLTLGAVKSCTKAGTGCGGC